MGQPTYREGFTQSPDIQTLNLSADIPNFCSIDNHGIVIMEGVYILLVIQCIVYNGQEDDVTARIVEGI